MVCQDILYVCCQVWNDNYKEFNLRLSAVLVYCTCQSSFPLLFASKLLCDFNCFYLCITMLAITVLSVVVCLSAH